MSTYNSTTDTLSLDNVIVTNQLTVRGSVFDSDTVDAMVEAAKTLSDANDLIQDAVVAAVDARLVNAESDISANIANIATNLASVSANTVTVAEHDSDVIVLQAQVTQLQADVATLQNLVNDLVARVGSGSTPIAINDLSDVTITSLLTNDGLIYNGTAWVNQP